MGLRKLSRFLILYSKHITCTDPLNLHNHPKRQPMGQKFYKCTEGLALEAARKGIEISKGARLCFHCHMEVTKAAADVTRLE